MPFVGSTSALRSFPRKRESRSMHCGSGSPLSRGRGEGIMSHPLDSRLWPPLLRLAGSKGRGVRESAEGNGDEEISDLDKALRLRPQHAQHEIGTHVTVGANELTRGEEDRPHHD